MPPSNCQWRATSATEPAFFPLSADMPLLTRIAFHPARKSPSEHDPEKCAAVFRKRSCSNKKVERDDDSKKSHPAAAVSSLAIWPQPGHRGREPGPAAGSK